MFLTGNKAWPGTLTSDVSSSSLSFFQHFFLFLPPHFSFFFPISVMGSQSGSCVPAWLSTFPSSIVFSSPLDGYVNTTELGLIKWPPEFRLLWRFYCLCDESRASIVESRITVPSGASSSVSTFDPNCVVVCARQRRRGETCTSTIPWSNRILYGISF